MELHIPNIKPRALYNKKLIENKYPIFYNHIMRMYEDSCDYNEKLYRYLHNIENHPICPVCNKPIPYRNSPAGYGKYCSVECMSKSEDRKKLMQNTKLEKYGDPYYNNHKKASVTMIERYGDSHYCNHEKSRKTCIEKYGVDNVFKLKSIQDKCNETKTKKYGDSHYCNHEKSKKTCIERYGVDNPMKNKEIYNKFIDTMINKYGCEYPMMNKDSVDKLSKSLIKAHITGKYNTSKKKPSKIEQEFRQYLSDNNIKFEYQYRSKEYPYLCDFFINDYNLYIEINGNWTHGKHPFDPNNIDDVNIVNKWKNKNSKFYDLAIRVWSVFDVNKRNIARNNNINYLEIFSIKLNECIECFMNKIKEIENGKEKIKK